MAMDFREPLKIALIDLDTQGEDGETFSSIELKENPETVTYEFGANYASHNPVGHTGEIRQFTGNKNVTFPIEFCYIIESLEDYEESQRARNFLESLMYPSDNATIKTNALPRVLVARPNSAPRVCRAETLRITDELTDWEGRVLYFTGTIHFFTIEEIRTSKEEIRRGINSSQKVITL